MILANISPYFAKTLERLHTCASKESLWHDKLGRIITAYEKPISTDAAIGLLQKARRMTRIFRCNLENNEEFRTRYAAAPLTNWEDFEEPPVPHDMQDRLVDQLYIVRGPNDIPVLEIGDQARYIGNRLFNRCVADGLAFDIAVHDDNFNALIFNVMDDAAIERLAKTYLEDRADVTTRILVQHNLPRWPVLDADMRKLREYRKLIMPFRERSLAGTLRSVLTTIPTSKDAEIDGIPMEDYAKIYFRMCDQPWNRIAKAQGHLIETLNAGKVLHFTNTDGTDFTINVDGFTFCNSTTARNVPGSEVFSAPHIDSAQGIIKAKGRFSVKEEAGVVIEDLTLRFEKGHLVEWIAEKGQKDFDQALSIDDGAKRIGEIGIGTNPYLKQHLSSILLAEKIGGSFHVALGDAYTMKNYMGTPVNVDNGNRSLLHWDITTMLHGKEGKIILDGTPIMENGIFLDPKLDVLNRGWQAVPFEARPEAWQKIYPE